MTAVERRAGRTRTCRADEGSQRIHYPEQGSARGRGSPSRRGARRPLPLAGLPIVVKDNINTADMPTSAGTPALQNARPRRNAPSLQKLLDAGAIVIGKANMHELAFGITSTNLSSFAGPVKNPYDKKRIPGGSSGGTSAAIAAGIVSCGLGSDTGGSTRVPAALTGTVGLRPSVGNGGAERRYDDANMVVPISHTRDTVGPMGRTVADVALLDSVITGTAIASRGAAARQAPRYPRRVLERARPRRRGRDEGRARQTRRRRRRSCGRRYAGAVRAERQGVVSGRAA